MTAQWPALDLFKIQRQKRNVQDSTSFSNESEHLDLLRCMAFLATLVINIANLVAVSVNQIAIRRDRGVFKGIVKVTRKQKPFISGEYSPPVLKRLFARFKLSLTDINAFQQFSECDTSSTKMNGQLDCTPLMFRKNIQCAG
ncbi:hypothetical protein PPACK8108_LOCUS25194 [Phakopsora pachyrhizi]|uniref:Uncharacterized protein n=1 Tax=Phakopsora pachyrhizi TaxID=170000 RepID=A0AAV0BU60_PHAPC|nr:hypothetical protein PPACK8108_LOCUS25194 [Phakopsora pachyrhizi]